MIKAYIEDLVKLYAGIRKTNNRKCRKIMETSDWAKEMWQEERK